MSSNRQPKLHWNTKCYVERNGESRDAWLSANAASQVFQLKVPSTRRVITVGEADHPQFSDYFFTFTKVSAGGDRTDYKVTFKTGRLMFRNGKKVQREWGRVAEHYYKKVERCRTWMPRMATDFAQYPRLRDVFAKLKGLLSFEQFWHLSLIHI